MNLAWRKEGSHNGDNPLHNNQKENASRIRHTQILYQGHYDG